jgi:hypothetical protein
MDNLINLLRENGIILESRIINNINLQIKNKLLYTHLSLLLTYDNRIISYGINKINNDKIHTIHSEIELLNNYKRLYKNGNITKQISKKNKKLIIIRLSKTLNIGYSKPCLNCIKIIKKNLEYLNISEIHYTNNESNLIKLNYLDLNNLNLFKFSSSFRIRNNNIIV